jgi:3-oxoacyl-[acyl-carrier-protein] synthase-3
MEPSDHWEMGDLYFFHQASRSVLDNIVRHLDLPNEKVFRGFGEIGNMVSASIPIAMKQAADQGRLLAGQKVMLVGFGVGYSWGSCLVTWTG